MPVQDLWIATVRLSLLDLYHKNDKYRQESIIFLTIPEKSIFSGQFINSLIKAHLRDILAAYCGVQGVRLKWRERKLLFDLFLTYGSGKNILADEARPIMHAVMELSLRSLSRKKIFYPSKIMVRREILKAYKIHARNAERYIAQVCNEVLQYISQEQ